MKTNYKLCLLLFTTLFINSCDTKKKDTPKPEEPKSYKDKIVIYDLAFNSDTTQATISWSQLENVDFVSYDLYRTEINVGEINPDNVDLDVFHLLARVTSKEKTSYTDDDLPFSPFFRYIVVARISTGASPYFISNFKDAEIKNKKYIGVNASEIFHNAAEKQMIVLSQSAATLSIYDYNCKLIKQVTIPNKALANYIFCFGAMGTFNNQPELYIPSGGIIYIYNPRTLDLIDKIETGYSSLMSVSSYKNLLFAGGLVINRETKELIQNPGDFGDFDYIGRSFPVKNKNSNFINSFFISLNFFPSELGVRYYNDTGKYVSTVVDNYHADYPLNAGLCKVAPNGLYLITDKRGAIYDYSLKFQKYLNGEPTNNYQWPTDGVFSDFEFNADGSSLFAALNNEKAIRVYDSKYNQIKTIPMKGYPVRVFYQNNELMVAVSEYPLRGISIPGQLTPNPFRIRFQRVKL